MTAWSLSYTGWLGFVLLLWACVTWRSRSHRHLALRSSPFLVGYASPLVLLSFVLGLRASQEELFPGVPGWLLTDLDPKPYLQPCLHLGAKSLCASVFGLSLRLQVLERWRSAEAKEEAWREDPGEASGPCSVLVGILGSIPKDPRVEYPICICASMLFALSFAGRVVSYKVVYVLLFLSWVAWDQIHYNSWRRILNYFGLVVVAYSMVVLTAIYTFQFQGVAGFFKETLKNLDPEAGYTTWAWSHSTGPSCLLRSCCLLPSCWHASFNVITLMKTF